ncbi:MAG TPA: hypothetical protein PKH07_06600, partial [bacterium]|nr:hypothetical protein [bacterium]
APEENVPKLLKLIPLEASFTVCEGNDCNKLIDIVIEKQLARDMIPVLARNGTKRISVETLAILYE